MNSIRDNFGADPQALARAVGAVMYERDTGSQAMGIRLEEIRPGFARMTMAVRPDMLNGHGLCHGGFIFTLADSAFAYACNSGNHSTVASGCAIEFLAPGIQGDVLQAEAVEQSRTGKTGVYDITITNQDGKRIALFRGKSYQIRGEIISDPAGER